MQQFLISLRPTWSMIKSESNPTHRYRVIKTTILWMYKSKLGSLLSFCLSKLLLNNQWKAPVRRDIWFDIVNRQDLCLFRSLENEKTHHRGKYDCLTGLDLTKTRKAVANTIKAKKLNPNKIIRRSSVQWYFPVSYLVFSALDYSRLLFN